MKDLLSRTAVLEESTHQQLGQAPAKLLALLAHTASGAFQSVPRLLHNGILPSPLICLWHQLGFAIYMPVPHCRFVVS